MLETNHISVPRYYRPIFDLLNLYRYTNRYFYQYLGMLVDSTVCTNAILITYKPPNLIEICSTKFFISYQYNIALHLLLS